jgi:PAS domain S-box-containing protein
MSNPIPEREGHAASPRADAWYQVTLAAIGDAVLTTDPDGVVTYMNPVAETLTGWSAAEARGKHLEDVFRIVNEETRKPTEQPVRKVIDTGTVRGLGNHTLLIAKDGSELPIDDSAAPVWGESGELVGAVLIFRDITERRHGERLLESARSYAESIVATVRGPLLVLDRELHVRTANHSFYETFAVTPPEVIGRFIYDLGDGQWDIPALRTLLEDIVPTNSCFEDFEVEHDFEHIGPKTMLLNARRFPPGGEYELLLLAIEDITERKRLERERGQLHRAAEEARARAEANEAKLAEADRRKDEFLTILSHELRNPLSSIRMAAHTLQRPGTEKEREWSLGVITHQVGALNRLIEDLLDVSRISKGKVHLRREALDLAAVIGHAADSVATLVREREHELTRSLPRGPMLVDGDATRLEQVFVNLLTNAAKYTPKGGRISLTAAAEGGDYIVRVRDTGEGIAADMFPRLFEMFTQVKSSTQRSRGGLGIGLSLVKDLVEMHGGDVTATSEGLGKGSEFVVRLPAAVR